MTNTRITGAVLTMNEALNIEYCLRSLHSWCDELVVVDMKSDDATPQLARRYTDLVLEHPQIVDFGLARQQAFDAATGDWILSLDADEIVTPELARWIREFIDSDPAYDVALLPRVNVFLGRWLRSTPWWPGKPRLFRKGAVSATTELHRPIRPKPGARIKKLPKHPRLSLWHFTRLSLEDLMTKTNRYTSIEAEHDLREGRGDPTARELMWRSLREVGTYVAKRGYRDGLGGLAYMLDRAYYRFLKQAKRWDIPRAAKRRAQYDAWRERILAGFDAPAGRERATRRIHTSETPWSSSLTLTSLTLTSNRDTNARVPDLFIVGAPKSGTTSLYEWLKGHPEVFMTPVKEPCYFSRDLAADKSGNFLRYDADRDRYLALFDGAGGARRAGEASTRYLFSKDAPGLIAAEVPDARVIAILRNPVDFIASLHAHKLAGGTEDLESLSDALDAEADRHAGRRIPHDSNPHLATYRDRARFGEQVPRWIDTFGRDQVKVMVFEEMVADPATHFRDVLEFLGVAPDYQPDAFVAHNPAHGARGGLVRTIARAAPVQFVTWRVLPAVLGDTRTRALARRVGHSKMRRKSAARAEVPVDLRRRLEEELAPDVRRLSEILGRDMEAFWFGSRTSAEPPGAEREPVAVS